MSLDLLLAVVPARPATSRAREIVTTSLDAMASGGMYDHIGFGFARYSVDREWLVPHFEKMLYDQALLVRVYAHAAVALDEPRWRQIVAETVEYVLRDLRQPDGGFSSAEDADSPGPDGHGHEGLFHTWTVDEVRDVLGADADAALEFWGIAAEGNFEGRSIPNRLHARGEFARPPAIEDARRRLFDARQQRPRPGVDDKVLTEWNALMISALAEAGAAARRAGRGSPPPSRPATSCASHLQRPGGRWFRSWHADGRPRGPPRRARRRPRLPRRRVHPAGRGHRRGPLDRRGRWPSPTRCSTTSGTSTTAGCSRRPTTARRSSPARRTSSTTPRRRPTRRPPWRCTAWPR